MDGQTDRPSFRGASSLLKMEIFTEFSEKFLAMVAVIILNFEHLYCYITNCSYIATTCKKPDATETSRCWAIHLPYRTIRFKDVVCAESRAWLRRGILSRWGKWYQKLNVFINGLNSLTTRIEHRITKLKICTLRKEPMIGEKQREQKEQKRNMIFFRDRSRPYGGNILMCPCRRHLHLNTV